ncbi:MAG: SdrD B-like domain-containing protein [Aurantibacter sp.]
MLKKLRNLTQLKFYPRYRKYLLLPNIILVILYLYTISQMSAQVQNGPFTATVESISYDFDGCRSFSNDGSNYDYSEFTPSYGNSCTSISGSQLYRNSGKHSCTNDEAGNAGDAACFQSSLDNQYSPDHTLAIRFDVTLSGNNGLKGRLDGISFKQLAPQNYIWSAIGYPDNTGPNNYPTKFGIRVLKDQTEIYEMLDIATSLSWETATFDFTNNADFMVDAGATSVFTFELTSYAPVGNGAAVSAWDLDDLKVFSSCEIGCNLTVNAGEDIEACGDELVELTAIVDGATECSGGCEYPIERIARCHNSSNLSDVWLDNISGENKGFVTSSSKFETFDDGTAHYTATGSNGIDDIEVDLLFSGYTMTPPQDSPKDNNCEQYDTSDWVYWTTTAGTITSEQHGTLTISRAGPSMQMGNGADVTRTGFGASGWLTVSGGDGFYTGGDLNIKLGECVPIAIDSSVSYLWSTGETTPSIIVTESGEYTLTATDCIGCQAYDSVKVSIGNAEVDAGEDRTICIGEEITLTAEGEGDYLWSTGETGRSIKVKPDSTTEYSVIVTNGHCEAMDEVIVTVEDKVVIGDYVWLDENRNGIQDEGPTGINGMSVKLFQCDGTLIDETETAEGLDGEGYYQFEVCPGSGDYHIVFGAIPDGLKFTAGNEGDDTLDSDADAGGVTACFTITNEANLTIDGGLIEICDINLDVVEEAKICSNETLELTATLIDNTEECEGGCEYPIVEQERCYGPTGNFEVWMVAMADNKTSYHKFKASEQRFETFDDGSARYTATASNGVDNIKVEALFTGYTTVAGPNGPKPNDCQQYDTSEWEYWSTWSGTITSENHGVFNLSMKGTYFQMGIGADVTRSGFGASGWFYLEGGDGYYTEGDVNVALEECIEKSAAFKWTTEDGNIIGDTAQKTITVDSPGTYVIEAVNCIDCVAINTVVVTEDMLCSTISKAGNTPKMAVVYPVPVQSGGTLTIEFDLEKPLDVVGPIDTSLKSSIDGNSKKENVSVVLYDMTGRIISIPRTFDLYDGKALIYLNVDHIPSGKYIVKAQGGTWSHSKNIIVK